MSEPDAKITVWKKEDMLDVVKQVVDPELHMNIVDLGLVYDVRQDHDTVTVDMTLTSPGCPYGPYIIHGVKQSLLPLRDINEVEVNIVWDPPWGPEQMTEEAKLELGFDV